MNTGYGNAMFAANWFGRVAMPIVRVFITTEGVVWAVCAEHSACSCAERCRLLAGQIGAFTEALASWGRLYYFIEPSAYPKKRS